MLTVKQLAEKLDVSAMTIYRNKPNNRDFVEQDNIKYIDESLEKEITKKVLKNKKVYKKEKPETNKSVVVEQMQQQIDYLKEIIKEKDEQIRNYTKLIDQQQQLNLKTMERLEAPKKEEPPEEQEESHVSTREEHVQTDEKQGFFKKLFK
ncbi:DUF536 domain-containing protein [Staphylococcus warneri]|uniref:DUF536 domain-containing protein n=1 Tax=Staphylococcus warneri TaxID=1292 RepID=UPI0016790712|nr:DUF536 domain-containing protein [Staphylococcus warneri]